MKMHMQLLLLLWLVAPLLLWVAAPAIEASVAKPNCPARCGNVVVPYPFGIGDPSCFRDPRFNLTCISNQLLYRNFKVRKISAGEATATVDIPMAYDCYNKQPGNNGSINFTDAPFKFSVNKNRFMATGCDTIATLEDAEGKYNMSSCTSLCDTVNVTEQGSCTGVGCCQATIPMGINFFKVLFATPKNRNSTRKFNCRYAFLADHDSFDFSKIDLSNYPKVEDMPITQVVLDWAIESNKVGNSGGGSCECGQNTECVPSKNGAGYLCRCKKGYEGNPYLPNGCQDINECEDPIKYPCGGTCKNTLGDYTCKCPPGKQGNGKGNKKGCEGLGANQLAAAIGSPVLLVTLVICTQYAYEKMSRKKNFSQNGGTYFEDQKVKTFSTANLRKATNNYDNRWLLGQGSIGEVYKGTLSDNTEVAVKKSKEMDENQIHQFRKEISLVSKLTHKNVVKLLGLCLETKVPQLVYEFIPNRTLFQHIHDKGGSKLMSSWKNRLRIATEIAQALDYFHSTEPPTIHGDIKSKNILIDGSSHTAKVSDFGTSTLFPSGQRGVAERVLGTMGYLDPEYLQTSDLTTKADVYSFGVVLVELLTGENPFPDERSKERRNVIQKFISSVERNRQIQFWKIRDAKPDEVGQMRTVATLAVGCLKGNGEERPTMKEVADELVGLLDENLGTQQEPEEDKTLVEQEDFPLEEEEDDPTSGFPNQTNRRNRRPINKCFEMFSTYFSDP